MKQQYKTFQFILACAFIFFSGYFLAKTRSDADKVFAPSICGIAVYHLWRNRNNHLIT